MGWLSEGEPQHECRTPWVSASRPDSRATGYDAGIENESGYTRDTRRVYPGARWQCDVCGTIHTLNDNGKWEREHGVE